MLQALPRSTGAHGPRDDEKVRNWERRLQVTVIGGYRESLEKDRILGTLDITIPDLKEDILSSKG